MSTEQENKDHFDATANNKGLWVMRANDLHVASRVLRERVASIRIDSLDDLEYAGLGSTAAMLQGFAIEVLLKAYWLAQGNPLGDDGEYSLPTLKRDAHQLHIIADAVGYTISSAEREILERLSLFVSSYGRYPVAKRWQQNPLRPDAHGIPHRISWSNDDHAIAEALIQRLKNDTGNA